MASYHLFRRLGRAGTEEKQGGGRLDKRTETYYNTAIGYEGESTVPAGLQRAAGVRGSGCARGNMAPEPPG